MIPIFRPEFVALQSEAASAEEVITQLSELFVSHQVVKGSYLNAVLEREQLYPTGLPSKELFVAIPHTDSTHVHESSIAVATLARPVSFGLMGDATKTLEVELVFLLAIADPQKHLALLTSVMGVLSNGALLREIKEAGSAERVVELLSGSIA